MAQEAQKVTVISADGKEKGLANSYGMRCQMEGCTGRRFHVVWSDGKFTRPCTKGMTPVSENTWQIS